MTNYCAPTSTELLDLIGARRYRAWQATCARIDSLYDMERAWNSGGRRWLHEYKYRRGGKTLCALYARKDCAGLMIIFGRNEREQFESARQTFSEETQRCYDEATTYHDGKWMLFPLDDDAMLSDVPRLLAIKRRPNRA